MARAKIDELNILSSNTENSSDAFDYHDFIMHYFDPMDITERQKRQRIEAAFEIMDAVLLFLIWCENAPERVQEEATIRSFENMYKEVVFLFAEPDLFMDLYVSLYIPQLIKVTLDHLGEEYFTSVERAAYNAANEANSVMNHVDLENAKLLGYTMKRWCTEKDSRVRPTHVEMEGVTIPIDDLFLVGESLMEAPHDITHGADASEISNCRCWVEYLKKEV